MFKLEFELDNATFDGVLKYREIQRILHDIADNFEEDTRNGPVSGTMYGPITDINGNRVGQWSLGVD